MQGAGSPSQKHTNANANTHRRLPHRKFLQQSGPTSTTHECQHQSPFAAPKVSENIRPDINNIRMPNNTRPPTPADLCHTENCTPPNRPLPHRQLFKELPPTSTTHERQRQPSFDQSDHNRSPSRQPSFYQSDHSRSPSRQPRYPPPLPPADS